MAHLTENGEYHNVEIKGTFDTNARLPHLSEIVIQTPYGARARVRVIHRKANKPPVMQTRGNWRYLVEYLGPA